MKYETAVPIGRGASGEVFRALDPTRDRLVALKLFPADDGASDARRLREARAQSRLRHPSICEIYEVGRNESGRGFIAMRYVDGAPVDEVCARLPLRDRVRLVREIADAVACAHEAGLIHRDLKPGNLLVEEQEDGSLRPFVLDFGIVKVAAETRLTETGQVLGTPGYLSPEQARGDTELDARSDVFSLGVVLWQVLTGRPPFEGSSSIAALLAVLEQEPPLASEVSAEVPPELAHVAARAMEKDPRRRYPSAAAMRSDLDRFLAADRVSARAVGPLGRLVRRAERRPLPWALGALLLLVAVAALGVLVRSRFEVQRQTRDAERFARVAGELQARMRFLEMLPEPGPEIGPGVEALEGALAELTAEVERSAGRARAAGEFAVGRTLLSLGRPDLATERLQAARRLGFTDTSGGLALARAQLAVAQRELLSVDAIGDRAVREAERARVLERLRLEALPLLEAAAAGSDLAAAERHLAQAMGARLLGELAAARQLLDRVARDAPWLYEAEQLRAETWYEEAVAARLRDAPETALTALDRQTDALTKARSIAPGAAATHRDLCSSALLRGQIEAAEARPVEVWDATFERAAGHCATARSLRPDLREARRLAVEVGWRHARQVLRWQGAEALGTRLDETITQARELSGTGDAEGAELLALGNALYTRALVRRDLAEPVLPEIEEAIEALDEAVRSAPGRALAWQSLGLAWNLHATVLENLGKDPRPSYDRALDAFAGGLTGSDLQRSRMQNAICSTRSNVAYYGITHEESSSDDGIRVALEGAAVACERALALDPQLLSAMNNLGMLFWTEAEWAMARGESPIEASDAGREAFGRLLRSAPEHVSGRNNLAGLIATTTRWQLDHHVDHGGDLDVDALLERVAEGRSAAEPLRETIPADVLFHLTRLAVHEAAALCEREPRSEATSQAWRRAHEVAAELVALDAAPVPTGARIVELHRRAAECLLAAGAIEPGLAQLAAGEREAKRFLEVDAGFAETLDEAKRLAELRAGL